MSVPSAALLAIVDRLGRKRDTLREYIEQADEQRMPEWVSRYTETHDAYQEAIDMIEECIANPSLQGTGHLVDRTLQGVVGRSESKGE